jgi:hypothetical protein
MIIFFLEENLQFKVAILCVTFGFSTFQILSGIGVCLVVAGIAKCWVCVADLRKKAGNVITAVWF